MIHVIKHRLAGERLAQRHIRRGGIHSVSRRVQHGEDAGVLAAYRIDTQRIGHIQIELHIRFALAARKMRLFGHGDAGLGVDALTLPWMA